MKHLSLKESTYNIIKDKILNLEIEPGSRIREDLLAEEISVSRTPVREAVHQLVAEGFIKNIPRKGVFCVELSPQEIADLLDVRLVLELLSIEKSIENITDEDIKRLEQINKKMEDALEKDNYKESNMYDSQFHKEIVKISENKKLVEFINNIESYMQITRNLEIIKRGRKKIEFALNDHKRMLDAVKTKDIEAAKKHIAENIETMKENLGI